MNCCDYNCNQGRDCPARKPDAALVARIKASHPAPTVEESDNTEGVLSLVFLAFCIASACIGLLVFGGK